MSDPKTPSSPQGKANAPTDLEISQLAGRIDGAIRARLAHQQPEIPASVARERRRRRVATTALVVCFPALCILLGLTLTGHGPFEITVPEDTPEQRRETVHRSVVFVAREIEMYKEKKGELPPNLTALGFPMQGDWTYHTIGPTRFQVTLVLGGQNATYDSAAAHPPTAPDAVPVTTRRPS